MKRILSSDFLYLYLLLLIWAGSTAFSGNDPTGLLASLRLISGIVFVLLVPGYAIQAAIFPGKDDLDTWTRLVFSFGFSIVLIPIVALILNASPLGIHFSSMVGGIVIVFFAATIVVMIIRRRLPGGEKIRLAVRIPPPNTWLLGNRADRFLQVITIVAIGIAGLSAAYLYLYPNVESYTEFYFLNQGLSAEGAPRSVLAGEPWVLGFGIINHEGQASQYRVIAIMDDGRMLGEIGPITLEDGMQWEGEMILSIKGIGENQKVNFLLERVGFALPYRSLRLWINVMENEKIDPEGTARPTD
jgi:uncharacterized membrane protein